MQQINQKINLQDKNLVWVNYVKSIIFEIWKIDYIIKFNLKTEAPCPICGQKMLRVDATEQHQEQTKDTSWVIGHVNNNAFDNFLSNLIPVHAKCQNKDN